MYKEERQMPIPKNARGRASCFAVPYILTVEIQERSGNCALHEQIVILLRSSKVLSKEQWSRLRE
jgi:hypothetical protein